MWELITSDLFDEWFKKQDDSLQETLGRVFNLLIGHQ